MGSEQTINVLFFAAAAERMLCGGVELPFTPSLTVGQLRTLFTTSSPSLAGLIERCAVAVNHEYAMDDQPLHPGDEVAIIPPVSGG